ncbi:MAG TPA: PD-(D/E)XK nuclease family transposase [Clostridiaceae bacterium]
MPKKKINTTEDNFIMSPKSDFVFKYIFGNEEHKDLLIALLSDILGVPEEEFAGIEIINSELLKQSNSKKKKREYLM